MLDLSHFRKGEQTRFMTNFDPPSHHPSCAPLCGRLRPAPPLFNPAGSPGPSGKRCPCSPTVGGARPFCVAPPWQMGMRAGRWRAEGIKLGSRGAAAAGGCWGRLHDINEVMSPFSSLNGYGSFRDGLTGLSSVLLTLTSV